MSPPAASNSNASLSGESDSNSNEKSENGSGESNSLISGSYTSGENSSSMKESDDMSHENETETGSKSDTMFVPVKKSHDIGKAPFWVKGISQPALSFQQGSAFFESNPGGHGRQKFTYSYQPEGVLLQLQELIMELHIPAGSDTSSNDSEDKKSNEYEFVTEEKTLKASFPSEKNNGTSSMGDSGFKSSGTSCNCNSSSNKQTGSSSSNASTGDSDKDKKDLPEVGSGTSSDKDSASGNEAEAKDVNDSDSGNADDALMDTFQIAQEYGRLVCDYDAAVKSKIKHAKDSKKRREQIKEECMNRTVKVDLDTRTVMTELGQEPKDQPDTRSEQDADSMSVSTGSDISNKDEDMLIGTNSDHTPKGSTNKTPEETKTCPDMPMFTDESPKQIMSLNTKAYDMSSSSSYAHELWTNDLQDTVTENDVNEYWSLLFTHSDDFITMLCI